MVKFLFQDKLLLYIILVYWKMEVDLTALMIEVVRSVFNWGKGEWSKVGMKLWLLWVKVKNEHSSFHLQLDMEIEVKGKYHLIRP